MPIRVHVSLRQHAVRLWALTHVWIAFMSKLLGASSTPSRHALHNPSMVVTWRLGSIRELA